MNNMDKATKFYKDVLQQDNMNVEAIACIATHYFYTDQPEIALKFYRQVFSVVLTLLLKLLMSIFPQQENINLRHVMTRHCYATKCL